VYNLASGVETSIRELALAINELAANPGGVDEVGGRDWDRSGRRFGSTTKAKASLGFDVRVPLREGLDRTIRWTREHTKEIEACIARHHDALVAYERSHQNAVA
jgi:UDP-glucose 4-epimerase